MSDSVRPQRPRHIIFKVHEVKDKQKILRKSSEKKKTLSVKEERYELYQKSPQKLCKQEESGVKYFKY